MDCVIRELALSDKSDFLDLINQFRPVDTNISNDKFMELYDSIHIKDKIFVAEKQGKLVGTITMIIEQKFIHNFSIYTRIEDLVVDNKHRGQKIGEKLVKWVIDESKKLGAKKISLISSDELISFYKKNSFIKKDNHMVVRYF